MAKTTLQVDVPYSTPSQMSGVFSTLPSEPTSTDQARPSRGTVAVSICRSGL